MSAVLICVFAADEVEERNLRRVSYLKATKDERLQIDSDTDEIDANRYSMRVYVCESEWAK